MYLLELSSDDAMIILFSAIASVIIFYFIIRGAVRSGTKKVKESIDMLIALKVYELGPEKEYEFINRVGKIANFGKAWELYRNGETAGDYFKTEVEKVWPKEEVPVPEKA